MKTIKNFDQYIKESVSEKISVVGLPSKEILELTMEQIYEIRKSGLIKLEDANYTNLGTQRGYVFSDENKAEIKKLLK